MTYYIKGGSRYNEANPTVWVALNLLGFADSKYLDSDWKQIDFESIIDDDDPFWLMGSTSGGAKELELGLYNDYRIKFETTGITYWDGDSWEDLLAVGGASTLNELTDVVITTPGDDEVLAWDTSAGKWINQTPSEAGLPAMAVSAVNAAGLTLASTKVITSADEDLTFYFGRVAVGYVASFSDNAYFCHRDNLSNNNYALLQTAGGNTNINAPTSRNIWFRINNVIKMALTTSSLTMSVPIAMGTSKITGLGDGSAAQDAMAFGQKTIASELNHNDLSNIDAGDINHLTDAQISALHAIYTLEAHAMDSATYHTSSDVTTLNANTSKHGFLKKLDNDASNFMNGQGNWATPPGGDFSADLMIGSANSAWIPIMWDGAYPQSSIDWANLGWRNTGATDIVMIGGLPIPTTSAGGLKLYIKGIKITISDSDPSNYVTQTRIMSRDKATTGWDLLKTIDHDAVHGTGSGAFTDAFTAVDATGAWRVTIVIDAISASATTLDVHDVLLDCYYDT